MNLALCYLKQKNYESVKHHAEKALEIDEANLKALYYAGVANTQLGHFDLARTHLIKAYNIDKQSQEILDALQNLQKIKQQQKEKEIKMSKKMMSGLGQVEAKKKASSKAVDVLTYIPKKVITGSLSQVKKGGSFAKKLVTGQYKILDNILYNLKLLSIISISFYQDRCCKRRMSSNMYKKQF